VPGGGIRPFGYDVDRKTVREDEAELIREAAGRVIAGEGLRTVVNAWTRRGVATVTGAQWKGTTLRRLLRSGRIMGYREHHGRLVSTAEWPAIIDEQTGRRLRRILDDPKRNAYDTTSRSYLLAGIVHCGLCGAKMVARPVFSKGHRYRRYGCFKEAGGCNRVGIGAQPLEDLITEAVMIRLDTPALSKAVAARRDDRKSTSRTKAGDSVADLEQRLDDLAEMFGAGEISKSEWATARARLVRRLDEAKTREAAAIRKTNVTDQLARPDVLRREWPEMTFDRQRIVLNAIIERITIAPTTKAGNKFNPDRVDVKWRV
jgi:hypothetical protein